MRRGPGGPVTATPTAHRHAAGTGRRWYGPRVKATRGFPLDIVFAAVIAGMLLLVFGRVIPNYDDLYAIAWGHQLANGEAPQYFAAFAPAAHPGLNLIGILANPLGPGGALVVFQLVGLLSLGALAVGLYRLGEAVGSRAAGVAAALILLSRPQTLAYGIESFVDAPAAALVVWAAVLEARTPRRGVAVLVVLGIAGLLRPETWLLAGAYAVWCAVGLRPRAVAPVARLVAFAAIGPALWILSDWIVTGDPLSRFRSLSPTVGGHTITAGTGGRTGLAEVPRSLVHDLGNWLGPIPLALAAIGCIACVVLPIRRTGPPLVAIALAILAFAAGAVTGAPLEQRYLFTAVALLTFMAGIGLTLPLGRLGPVRGASGTHRRPRDGGARRRLRVARRPPDRGRARSSLHRGGPLSESRAAGRPRAAHAAQRTPRLHGKSGNHAAPGRAHRTAPRVVHAGAGASGRAGPG